MAEAFRCEPGGIAGLLDLIGEHEPAFVYDWRTRFGLGLSELFAGDMSWAEAVTLTRELLADPSSRVCAAVSGWEYPISREGLILADHFDLHAQVNSKSRPKPYPRPMDAHRKRSTRPIAPQHVIRRALAARGHSMN